MEQTMMRVGGQDLFGINNQFKVYVLAVESSGVAIRVENGGKKPRDHYIKGEGKAARLAPDAIIRLDKITEDRLAELTISHPDGSRVRTLKSKLGCLVVTRRRAEQLIIDAGKAVVTVMAFDENRCSIHVAQNGQCKQKYLVVGEQPVTILPKVKAEFFGIWGNNQAKIKLTAPRHVVIDRHEVHMKKEYDVNVISDKRAPYRVKNQPTKKVANT